MTRILEDATATVYVEGSSERKHSIRVEPREHTYVATPTWDTNYPFDLIEHVFSIKGPAYLCDEIRRDEDPGYLEETLRWAILSYVTKEELAGRRILDYGSGCGSSTIVLSRLFPDAGEIVGVELLPELVELAERRARFYGIGDRVSFHISPDPANLPADIGEFDSVVLSAVWEHLLPSERADLLSLLWRQLKPGGYIFLNQTPYRWAPFESHTTALPLINYFPDRLTKFCANRFSKKLGPNTNSWETLLRQGIRGGAGVREITNLLKNAGHVGEVINPSLRGVSDRIGLWYSISTARRKHPAKILMRVACRAVKMLTGQTIVPVLTLAIRKES